MVALRGARCPYPLQHHHAASLVQSHMSVLMSLLCHCLSLLVTACLAVWGE